jgi:hypothetical protein
MKDHRKSLHGTPRQSKIHKSEIVETKNKMAITLEEDAKDCHWSQTTIDHPSTTWIRI